MSWWQEAGRSYDRAVDRLIYDLERKSKPKRRERKPRRPKEPKPAYLAYLVTMRVDSPEGRVETTVGKEGDFDSCVRQAKADFKGLYPEAIAVSPLFYAAQQSGIE